MVEPLGPPEEEILAAWQLVGIVGRQVPARLQQSLTLVISEDDIDALRLDARLPCNNGGGRLDVTADGRWQLDELPSEQASCGDGLDEAEQALSAALTEVDRYRLVQRLDATELLLERGSTTLRFVRVEGDVSLPTGSGPWYGVDTPAP